MAKTSDALKIINQLIGDDVPLKRRIEEEVLNARVAQLIYDYRTRAGLTQAELAKKVGTRQPVIARLEDADYEGHSLPLLRRIAAALDRRVEIRFMPLRRKPSQPGEHGSPALG